MKYKGKQVLKSGNKTAPIKKTSHSEPTSAVPIDQLSSDELMAVIRRTFDRVAGIDHESAVEEIAHELGYNRVGSKISEVLQGAIKAASRRRIICRESDLYYPDCRVIMDYPRDILKNLFLSAIGRTWKLQEEAIREAACYLGFLRTGSTIQNSFKSIINGLIRQGEIERDGVYIKAKK